MPDIFEYLDYRKFLEDHFAEIHTRNPHYSLRAWSDKLELNVSSLTRILHNQRTISSALSLKFCEYCKFSKKEKEYFQTLVAYNQAKTLEEKKEHFERLLSFKGNKIKLIDRALYQFFDKWYYVAVRELIDVYPFSGDFAMLGKRLDPRITAEEAENAIKLLEKLGLIAKNDEGVYKKTDPLISTGKNAQALSLDSFQVEMLSLALRAIDHFPRESRSFSTLSLSISHKEYQMIIEELREFRKRALAIALNSEKPDRIYQFNFQVFPLST